MRSKEIVGTALLVLIAACGRGDRANQQEPGRDLSLAPVDSTAVLDDAPRPETPAETVTPAPAPAPSRPAAPRPNPPAAQPAPAPAPTPAPPAAPATRSVASGTNVALTSAVEFSTKPQKVGQTVTANVPNDVTDDAGRVVIPAGATVTLVISELAVSENKSDSGKVSLRATQVAFGGETYDIDGVTTSVSYELKGRGVQAGDAAKVGAGAAAGAIVGRVVGGNKKGTVVGGVIGADAGTAVAVNSADRDVVVASGARISLRLRSTFEAKAG